MADDSKQTFPMIPVSNWWTLRDRFKMSMPPSVSSSYLETVLKVSSGSAKNILYTLNQLTLLDDQYSPTNRAERWRHDDTYSSVCREIREDIYPEELFHAAPNPSEDRAAAERWFAGVAKVGTRASQRMAQTYQLLMEADPSKKPEPKASTPTKSRTRTKSSVLKVTTPKAIDGSTESQPATKELIAPSPKLISSNVPSLHIDIQIHIDSDATPEQIDQIFASMAKHLYKHEVE